jgi:hypothetical protein
MIAAANRQIQMDPCLVAKPLDFRLIQITVVYKPKDRSGP